MSDNNTEYRTSRTHFIFCILLIVTGVWFPSWFMWVVWAFVGYVAVVAVLTIIAFITALVIMRKITNLG